MLNLPRPAAGEEIQWDWFERRNAPWGGTALGGPVGTVVGGVVGAIAGAAIAYGAGNVVDDVLNWF
jgi:hypothetical protein